MAMHASQHVRVLSTSTGSGNKKRHSGTARPVLASRKSTDGKKALKRRSIADTGSPDADDDDESPSFLQFCAYCDRQIVVPTSSILYCSESCRHKDSASSQPASPLKTPVSPYADEVTRDLIPPLSPTVKKMDPFFRIPSQLTMTPAQSTRPTRPGHERTTSEAARYLAQFHNHGSEQQQQQQQQQQHHMRQRSSQTVPSLSHSLASTASSMPYTPVSNSEYHRSLPSGRSLHADRHSSKSVDLVNPAAAVAAASSSLETITAKTADMGMWERAVDAKYGSREFLGDEDGMSYEKRRGVGGGLSSSSSSSAAGSLKQLFGKERGVMAGKK